MHTNWSDGKNTIEEMARAARRRGYRHIPICDHSVSLGIAHGLQRERLDLSDLHCHKAKGKGVKLAVSTGAHMTEHLEWMKFGMATARRGWIELQAVIKPLPLLKLLKSLHL